MTSYFKDEYLAEAKKEYKKTVIIYSIFLALYIAYCTVFFVWYLRLPYKAKEIGTIKACIFVATAIFVIFSFVYLGIKYKRAKAYKTLCQNMVVGLKESSTADFLEYEYFISEKDGVEMRSLLFLEYNKYKKENYERRVYVFADKDMPLLEKGQKVNFITQANILCEYEITQGE